ncbi:unnamed protein product [Adineta steineri]|uniref:Amine oxidase n=1 Tax=Adineta steineri TaxID=433720 RepID=A0A813S6L0_9BILA|nr:unnamed protein product [Adineta steineri]CAF0824541.1 unnamed protein product [Adineta steineri]
MTCLWFSIFAVHFFGLTSASITQPEYAFLLAKSRTDLKSRSATVSSVIDILQEYSLQMNNTHQYGLPKCQQCHRIGIIGAGVSGLYAGILLAKSGHTVVIYEANQRAGGRVYTYRDPDDPTQFVGELGAMRFPLDVHPYLNYMIRNQYQLNITEFSSYDPNTIAYINGISATVKGAEDNPDLFGFKVNTTEKGKTPDQLWNEAVEPLLNLFYSEGWNAVRTKWDSQSIITYLRSVGLSRAAVDYISLISNFETNLFTSLLEALRDMLVLQDSTQFYRIQGGSDLLITAMIDECMKIEGNRCSLLLNTKVTQVQLYAAQTVRITSSSNTDLFNSVIVATTATASQLINFNTRSNFIDKYRSMRQLHYDCSSKILLFFNSSWWFNNENINGGRSVTDLPIRFVYYPQDSNVNGGVLVGSYTWSQDSLLWQSLSDDDAIELALKNLIELHPTTGNNIRTFFRGGKVKHWCEDEYARGAFALFTPLQETDIFDDLKLSVSNIHFIGEHTSSAHAWVEGAILSSLRSALIIQKETYDVVIIGGGPIGLATAVRLSLKQPTLSIAIVEQGYLLNSDGSSGTFDQRQFRQMYNEIYLAELANLSVPLWHEIEQLANLSRGAILNTDEGYLFYGDFNSPETVEGDLPSIQRTCELLQMGCIYLNSTQLQARFPFFKFAPHYQGLLHSQSGYINVTTLINALLRIIEQNPKITIRQNEQFLSIDKINYTDIVTSRGSIHVKKKILFVPGPFAKNIADLLDFNLNVTLWEMPYVNFRLRPNATQIPTWFAWGGNDYYSLFSGFPIDPTSEYISIVASFIQNLSEPLLYPSQRTNVANPFIIKKIIDFVAQNLSQVDSKDYFVKNRTCLATFLPDNGFLLDYVPNTNRRVLMQAAGWGMKFVPVWADILSDMILLESNDASPYAKYLPYFSLSRPYRLITNANQGSVTSSSESNTNYSVLYYLTLLIFLLRD